MDMFNSVRKNSDTNLPKTTTLMIDNVPSKIAYDILMHSVQRGENLSPDELRERINSRMMNNGTKIDITFKELVEYYTTIGIRIWNEEKNEVYMHMEDSQSIFDRDGRAR